MNHTNVDSCSVFFYEPSYVDRTDQITKPIDIQCFNYILLLTF